MKPIDAYKNQACDQFVGWREITVYGVNLIQSPIPCRMDVIIRRRADWIHLTVEQGIIVSGYRFGDEEALTVEELEAYQTVDELFLELELSLQDCEEVTVTYDQEYGYPQRYQICPQGCTNRIETLVRVSI